MTPAIRRPDGTLSTYKVTNPAWAPDTVEIETVEDDE